MPIVDEELLFHIDEKNKSVDLTDKGINMLTRAGEDPEFFVLPDINIRKNEIEKDDLPSEEKLHQKEALLNEYAQKADRIHGVQQLLKAYTF
jgi:preprotein translocase subunit SecA